MELTVHSCSANIHKCTGVACLTLHIAKKGPVPIAMADGVPEAAVLSDPTHMQFVDYGGYAYWGNTYTLECARIAHLTLHIAKGLPAAVNVADCMPDPSIGGDATDMEFTNCSRATDIFKRPRVTCLFLHIAKRGLPGPIKMAERMPDVPIKWGDATDLQFAKHGSDAYTAECTGCAGVARLALLLHITKKGPATIGMAERMPETTIRSDSAQ